MSECLRCGECCISNVINLGEITDKNRVVMLDRLRWLTLHRCDTQIATRENGSQFDVLRIPLVCKNLAQDKQGKYLCKDYENRPQLCKDFECSRIKGIPGKT